MDAQHVAELPSTLSDVSGYSWVKQPGRIIAGTEWCQTRSYHQILTNV